MAEENTKGKAPGIVLGVKLKSLRVIEPSVIYAEAGKGTFIKECIAEAFELAKIKNTPVLFIFGEESILVKPDSDPYNLIDDWYSKIWENKTVELSYSVPKGNRTKK